MKMLDDMKMRWVFTVQVGAGTHYRMHPYRDATTAEPQPCLV